MSRASEPSGRAGVERQPGHRRTAVRAIADGAKVDQQALPMFCMTHAT